MLLTLDHASGAPLYQQIAEQVCGQILAGRLSPGEPLPSIRQLAADLVISVITTKRAYQELEAQGLIVTLPGRGTFVAELDRPTQRAAAVTVLTDQAGELVRQARMLGLSEEDVIALARERWHEAAREGEGK